MEKNTSSYIVIFIVIYFLSCGQDCFNASTFPSLWQKKKTYANCFARKNSSYL